VATDKDQAPKKRRILTKSETVRDKVAKTAEQEAKPRRLQKTTHRVAAPLRFVGRGLRKISRYTVPPYFRNSWRELRQVTWPKGKESAQLTLAVILFAAVFGAIVFGVDTGLDKVFKQVLIK